MSFFSLVIPVYNNEETIIRTLKSIKVQTYQGWECILIDDSSNDGSISIVKNYISGDNRFILLERKEYTNIAGANSCRNIGISYSDYNWIIFIDADDTLTSNCLANRRREILENPLRDFYVFKTAIANDKGEINGEFTCKTADISKLVYMLYIHHIPWHTMSLVWDSKFLRNINGWNINFERLQDVELNIRALLNQPRLYFSDKPYDSIYWAGEMDTRKKRLARFGFCRLVKDYHFKILEEWPNDDEYSEKISYASEQILNYHIQNYLCYEKKDPEWEELYLNALSDLLFSKKEIRISRNAFFKKND
ncbi:glycosyltransferase family A protein [Sphingobacterium sp.]|uniref:glycosyltransferase family 2 protein n=1 Tax=Sphingobacterium sp. TaxID=341027 RepID=UPI0031DE3B85